VLHNKVFQLLFQPMATRLLWGGNVDNSFQGSAWVYTRSGSTWTQQESKLVGTGSSGAAQQGISVALSADGNTAIVGGYGDNSLQGAAWVYTRSGGAWTQQGNKLVGTDNTGAALQGCSVSLSADGNKAMVGGYGDNSFKGAAWAFTRSGSTWTQQGSKLVGTGNTGSAYQGNSVALSADGNTAIVGGFQDNSGQGAAWVFIPPPTITSFTPVSGSVGTLVTITGTNLSTPTALSIGGVAAIPVSNDGTTLVAMVMPGAQTGSVSVTTAGGSATSGSSFTVTPTPYPSTQQGSKLVGTGGSGAARQGISVALSADGNTALVGGIIDNSGQGAVWVYTRSGGVWTQQGSKLVGTGGSSNAQQGFSVAISADGNTAIVGGNNDNSGRGASWVFARSGGTWTQQGSKLVGTGAQNGDYGASQGNSVALSADGNTAIVGGKGDNSNQGAAWVYTRSGGAWTQQGNKLVGTGSGAGRQGNSVALSADGNTAIVGGDGDNSNKGAAWVYTRNGGAWTQQGNKLVGTGSGLQLQGSSVALSADGNTAIVGGIWDNSSQGAAWVYTRSGGAWTQQGNKLVGTGGSGAAQGSSVALSADGNTAMVGGYGDNSSQGAVWVYTRSAGTWTQQGSKMVGTGGSNDAQQGWSVALSANGNTAMVGGFGDNSQQGAAWVFVPAPPSPPTLTTFTPASGSVGTLVTITGTNLSSSTALSIGGVAAIPISNNGTTLAAIVMPGATTGTVSVTTAGGSATSGSNFTVTPTPFPSSQQGSKLEGAEAVGDNSQQGWSVALSADGNTAIVGGYRDNSLQGAAWVYTRSGSTWAQQGNKLVGTGAVGGAQQGSSVALSADGNTALVGGNNDNSGQGAVWVYTRSDGTWTQQGGKLVGTEAVGSNVQQGESVAVSADGNTVIVGGLGDNSNQGAAWVYTRAGGTWTQQGNKLVGTGAVGGAQQGSSVALSADGNTVIVGGFGDNSNQGAAWVYTRSGSTWAQQGNKLVGTGNSGTAFQGESVAVSADGNTVIVGGLGDNSNQGAVWVYTRSGGTWTQQGNKLVGTGAVGGAQQGSSVALSADGNTAMVGGWTDNDNKGAAWVYTRSGGTWTQRGNKLVGTGAVGSWVFQGISVALSADGNTAMVGGRGDNSFRGAAWVFITPPPTITAAGTLTAFTTCAGTASAAQSFTVSGANLTANLVLTGPTGFEVSTALGSSYGSSVSLTPTSGTVSTTTIYVRLASTATGSPSGNVTCTSSGATTQIVAATGVVFQLSQTVTSNITSGTVVITANQITATNQISNANVTYNAGLSVTLLPGFQVTGNTFKAQIGGGCN
jgi:hypothetical protein